MVRLNFPDDIANAPSTSTITTKNTVLTFQPRNLAISRSNMGELSVDMRILAVDELTIDQVHTAYKRGTYTARHLTEAYIARIKALDQTGPKLNAITAVSTTALDEAVALDHYFESNSKFIGPLHGIPVIVKDQCDTKGLETTYGNLRCKHIPTEDATLVKRLRDAGAIVLAKSTMPGTIQHSFISSAEVDHFRFCCLLQLMFVCQWRDAQSIRYDARNWRVKCWNGSRHRSKLWSYWCRRRHRRFYSSSSFFL